MITLTVPILDVKGVQIGSSSVCLDLEKASTCSSLEASRFLLEAPPTST